jgi:hypothetical protein
MRNAPKILEPLFSFRQVAEVLGTSPGSARQLFIHCPGLVNLSSGKRPTYRVPLSLLLEVMVERGYSREQADATVRRHLAASAAA